MSENTNESLTVGKIIKELSPGQLWSVLIAAATIVAGAFTLGQHFDTTSHGREPNLVPCSQVKDWPKGVWLTWGRIDSKWKPKYEFEKFPQISQSVVFNSNFEYSTQTDQDAPDATKNPATINQLRGRLEEPLQAGSVFRASGEDGTGYTSNQNGGVTADGCMINTTFSDSAGNRGSLHYLFQRDRYYVQR